MSTPPTSRERALSHQEYLDTLLRPSLTQTRRISDIQVQKEHEIDIKYHTAEATQAATQIQRTYRGHRERRQLSGLTLDPSSRWIELIKEWRYRNAIAVQLPTAASGVDGRPRTPSDVAKSNWRRAGDIAEHAVAGEYGLSPDRAGEHTTRATRPRSDTQSSLLLDLRYFLEMVDEKHRYGTNLQAYHEEWQRSKSDQNFFIWLDHGEGKALDLPLVGRQKLDQERVRYLSKEERVDYLVQVDSQGLLRWAKNDELITTSADRYQDTLHGIALKDATNPDDGIEEFHPRGEPTTEPPITSSSDSDSPSNSPVRHPLASTSADAHPRPRRQPRKQLHVSPATILNSLLRATVKPGTWIYVADTVGRLYVGIKASGAFQHASFLSGARISSAGAISIENGRLTYLSPLSGHYRPTTRSFREFVERLQRDRVDLAGLKVSKAYAVLLGIEYYGKTKVEVKKILRKEKHGADGKLPGLVDGRGAEEAPVTNPGVTSRRRKHAEHQKLGKLLNDLHLR